MKGYIDGIDFYNLPVQKYYAPPKSWDEKKIKEVTTSRIFSGEWWGSRKRDGAYYLFCKDEDGNMYLRGRSKSVSGEYLDKIDWVPHLMPFFESLDNGTCLIGELYLKSNEQAKSTTSIMNCLKEKAIKRQEKEPLIYYVFDVLAWDGVSLIDKVQAIDRFGVYLNLLAGKRSDAEYVEFAKYYSGKELWNQLQEILEEGGEGVVITEQNSYYQPDKRPSKQCLKVKKELQETIDCVLMGVNPPTKVYTGKEIETWPYWFNEYTNEKIVRNDTKEFEETGTTTYKLYLDGGPVIPVTKNWFNGWAGSFKLGAYKDGKLVEIGNLSGVTDEMKENWKNYVGKVCVITAMEIMDNAQGGKGLRHPRFVEMRTDKRPEECLYEQIE